MKAAKKKGRLGCPHRRKLSVLGTRGAGQELRWDADLVLRTLNRRPAAARTAGADPRALRLRELLTRMAERATGDGAAAYSAAAYQVANLFDLPTKEQP